MDISSLPNYLDKGSNYHDFTSHEISIQPFLWRKVWDSMNAYREPISDFLEEIYQKPGISIILTGAGTSAYIGDTLHGSFQKYTGLLCRSISSTSLITHPERYIKREDPVLIISFARSGDSPESLGVINLSNSICKDVSHLIITCNPHGDLARYGDTSSQRIILLPEITNDKGLAMTGSFTSMLLSGLLVSRINDITNLKPYINTLFRCGEYILKNYADKLKDVSEMDFSRAVFLGSGPFEGIASESHLKLQELTLGKIICKHDSFLGFRHGPKAVLDKNTLIVYLFSNDKYVQKFEKDLVKEIHEQKLGKYLMGIYDQYPDIDYLDTGINMGYKTDGIDEEFLTLCYILPAQILAYYSSRKLGLDPDTPSESGIITRVVRGVNIYSYP